MFHFKKRNITSGPHLLGIILVAVGLIALLSPLVAQPRVSLEKVYLVGTGAMVFGFLLFTTYHGTLIDTEEKKFRNYHAVGGFKFGEWIALPIISKVRVISFTSRRTNTPNGISPTFSGTVTNYSVLLYEKHNGKPFLRFSFNKKNKAMEKADFLSAHLGVPLDRVD